MKVEYFVDEMPRDCASCKHYYMNCADGYSCSKLRKEIHPNFSEGMGYRIKECPLQSLADYTKQVRKEVCEEIRNFLNRQEEILKTIYYNSYQMSGLEVVEETKEVLDQIQGE